MSPTNDVIAAWALALVFPAVLFITALYVRQMQSLEYEPARTAQRILTWYSAHSQIGLWVLLVTLPLAAFIAGSAALLRTWRDNQQLQDVTWRALNAIPKHLPAEIIAAATLAAAGVLAMIAGHLLRK
jgi:hypothetical protein